MRCRDLRHAPSAALPLSFRAWLTRRCRSFVGRRFALGAKGLLAGQPQTLAQWEVLWEETDAFTQGWLSAGLTAVTGERPPPPPPRAQTTAEPAEAEDGGVGAEAARVAPNAASTSGTADSAQDSAAAAAGASAKRRRRDSLDEEEGGWVLVEEEDGADGGCGGAAARSRPPPPEVVNVLVTAGCLLPTLAKLILFKLDKVFPLTHGALPCVPALFCCAHCVPTLCLHDLAIHGE